MKGQSALGIIGLLIAIIIGIAVLVPVAMQVVNPTTIGTTINNTYTFTNTQGTSSFPLNTYINGYKNNNVTEYSSSTTANFTGVTNGSSVWLKLWVNGALVASSSAKATSLSDAAYALNYSKSATYKFTVGSNESGYANTTYWLILKPHYYLTSAPNASIINTLIYLIPLLIAVLIIVLVARYIGFF